MAGVSLGTSLGRGLRLRCPVCGQGRLFRGWFTMFDVCSHCGLKFERAPGFFLGSIFVNYGVTAVIVTAGYLSLLATGAMTPETLLAVGGAFVLVFPLWFFRYARSIWLAINMWLDPVQED